MRYLYKLTRVAKIKSPKMQVECWELPNNAGGKVENNFYNIVHSKMLIPYNPAIPLLVLYLDILFYYVQHNTW